MSLKLKAFEAGRWTAMSALLVTGLQLLQTVILARILVPEEFGLMAIVAALLAILGLFADLGLSRALIHYDDVPSETLSSLYWLNLASGLMLMVSLVLLAPLLGVLYQSESLVPVLQLTSLLFPLAALGQQFRALAEKDLRFGALAMNEVAASSTGVVAAIGVALANGGVYALVVGILVRASISSLLALWFLSDGRRPSWHLSISEARPYLRFGGYLVGENLASMLHRQADVFIGGMVSSPSALGFFAVPRDLSLRLALVINPVLTRVGFPVMARVKHDRGKLKSIYLQTLHMTASINFPLYVGLALFSDEVVALLYGHQWQDAGIYLRILALWGLLRSIGNPVGSLIYAVGRARLAFWWNMGLLVVIPLALWIGAHAGGLIGLAWMMLALQAVVIVPAWRLLVRPLSGIALREYVGAFVVPLVLATVSAAGAGCAANLVDGNIARASIGCAAGGAIYFALSLWFNRDWTDAMRELVNLPARRA